VASNNTEYRDIYRQLTQLSEQVRKHDIWFTPDGIDLFVCEIYYDPPAFLVDLKNLTKLVNDHQGVINWVRKKFNLVKRGPSRY